MVLDPREAEVNERVLMMVFTAVLGAMGLAYCEGDRGAGARAVAAVAEPTAAAADVAPGLVWKGEPTVFAPRELPRDRILAGVIRNASGGPVELRVDRVDVTGRDGRSLGANVRFVGSFGHGLYGPGGPPAPLEASAYDQERLGERLTLAADAERPITVAWRVPEGRSPAARLEVSGHALPLP